MSTVDTSPGGVAASAEPVPAGPPGALEAARLVRRFVGPVRALLGSSVVLAIVAAGLELAPYWLIYRLVRDVVAGRGTEAEFFSTAWLGVGAVLGWAVFLAASVAMSHRAAFAMLYDVRIALARALGRLPLGFFSRTRSGEVKKVLQDGTERIELLVAHAIPDSISAGALWLAVSVWMVVVDWRLALAAMVMVPVAFGCMSRAMRDASARMGSFQAADTRMNGSIVEYLAGMPVVKVFNRSGDAFAETSEAVRDYTRLETEWGRAWIPFGGAFYVLILANIVVILPVGLGLLAAGAIDVPTLLFFAIVGAHYSRPLLKLHTIFVNFAHISYGARQVADILDAPGLPDSGARIVPDSYDIEFDGVGFGYEADREVLHDISFTAASGQLTALVGPSGSGKTTIARLVPRFVDVTHGAVRLGGHDVRDIGLEALMDTVAFVFQDTYLFHDTIAANLRVGRPDADDAALYAAARAARCHDFVTALPEGYDTVVGERGSTLSGGERQRIAVARAILKDAPVVVLDEATAFVDPENEAALQDAIGALAAGRTVLVIAHRLSTIAGAHRILVVDGGRIVESGRHDELVAAAGTYARLWNDFLDAQSVVLHR